MCTQVLQSPFTSFPHKLNPPSDPMRRQKKGTACPFCRELSQGTMRVIFRVSDVARVYPCIFNFTPTGSLVGRRASQKHSYTPLRSWGEGLSMPVHPDLGREAECHYLFIHLLYWAPSVCHLMWIVTHGKRPRCWERLRAGGEVGDRGWDGWMASPTQWTWVWANSERQWKTRKPGVL